MTKVLVIKSVTMGEGVVKNCLELSDVIYGRPLITELQSPNEGYPEISEQVSNGTRYHDQFVNKLKASEPIMDIEICIGH